MSSVPCPGAPVIFMLFFEKLIWTVSFPPFTRMPRIDEGRIYKGCGAHTYYLVMFAVIFFEHLYGFADVFVLLFRRGTVVRHGSCISDRETQLLCQLQCATCAVCHFQLVFNVTDDNLCSPRATQKTGFVRIFTKISL